MSTHCNIIVESLSGGVKGIYVHFDGYPHHMVRVLQQYYSTLQEAQELVALGDLSSCKGPKETIAYHRDRGEELHIETATSLKELLNSKFYPQEYCYLFRDGKWWMNKHDDRTFKPVE